MQEQVEQLLIEIQQLKSVIALRDSLIARMEERIRLEVLRRFANKSEKYEYIGPSLFDEVEEIVQSPNSDEKASEEGVEVKPHTRHKSKKRTISEFYPRTRIEHDLSEAEKYCAQHEMPMKKIGEDVSEQIDIKPAEITVLQHVRPKYACPCCEGNIVQKAMPPQPIPGSKAAPGLLAYIAVSKYVDHLPLYRLESIFKRVNLEIPRLTMARWMIKTSGLLVMLYNQMEDALLERGIIQVDETTIQVLKEKDRPPQSKSYMWVRAAPETTGPPIILYEYAPTRSGIVLENLLAQYQGILQTDGYSAYDAYCIKYPMIDHAGCLAHCRRKFWEAYKGTKGLKKGGLAFQAIERFRRIYEEESKTKDIAPDERFHHRNENIKPLFNELGQWMLDHISQVPTTLALGQAFGYLQSQWPKLEMVFTDARIPLDTNFVENKIRPFTLGRKNWLFADSVGGAKASAIIYSIVETAKANGIEPYYYLKLVLSELPKATTAEQIENLLPWNVKKNTLH